MNRGPLSRRSSSPRRPTAGVRPTSIAVRSSTHCASKHRTGCQWRMLPTDVPPMSSVRSYFDTWNRDGTFVTINDTLRNPARHALNRDPEPSISVLDSPFRHNDRRRRSARRRWGKQRSTGANGNVGLIRMGSCCACSCIQQTSRMTKARSGFWPRIITRFLGCKRFGWTKDTNKGEMNGCNRTRRYA